MTHKTLALLIGGLMPAILLGCSPLFQKMASQAGAGTGPWLVCVGVVVTLFGGVFTFFEGDTAMPGRALFYSILFSLSWVVATAGVAVAVKHFQGQISQLVSLFNMNTLIATALGLLVLQEWITVSPWNAAGGAVLIVLGGILAARA